MKKKDLEKIGRLTPQVLIAGGASYLGTSLADKLLESGFKVWVLDDFSSGKSEEFKNLCSNKNFHFWTADINKEFPEEVKKGSLDFIFHLARLELRSKDKSHPLSTLVTNATGTKNLLDLAREKRARFLLASSVGVGNLGSEEEHVSPVLEAKRFAEALVSEYRGEFNLNARVARLAEVYGPSMDLDSSGTLGRLLKELLSGEKLTVYGEGLQKEYYVYIDDAVEGLCDSMFSAGEVKTWRYIVAPQEAITTLELVYKVRDVSAIRVKTQFSSAPQPYQVPVKTVELQGEYPPGWKPSRKLEEGIEETVSAFRQKKAYQDLEEVKSAVNLKEEKTAQEKKVAKDSKKKKIKEKKGKAVDLSVVAGSFGGVSNTVMSFLGARGWLFFGALILLFLFFTIPLGQYWLFRTRSEAKVSRAEQSYTEIELDAAVQDAEKAKNSAEISQKGIQNLSWVLNLLGAKQASQRKVQELRTLNYLSQYLYYSATAFSPLETVLRTQAGTVSGANYYTARADVARARQMLLMTEAELSSRDLNFGGAEPAEGWDSYIGNSKERLNFLEAFVRAPSATSSASLRRGLEKHGWEVETSL